MELPHWQRVTILSGWTARRLLAAEPGEVEVSLDLGRSRAVVRATPDGYELPDGRRLGRVELAEALQEPQDCAEVGPDGGCRNVYLYDDERCTSYKLFQPVEDRPPTIIINGMTMHPIVSADPWEGTAQMVEAVPRPAGECFDTCCGLGYSAQMLRGRGFGRVVTCEVDPNVLRVAAMNPWSEALFRTSGIEIVAADLRDYVAGCADGRFGCVFHDPPTVYQSGELYAEELYRRFARVLRRGGVLYHYVGTPGARRGQDYARGVMRRLQSAGFVRVRRAPGGVLGLKGGA